MYPATRGRFLLETPMVFGEDGDQDGDDATEGQNADENNDGEDGDDGGKIEYSAEQQKHMDKVVGDARKAGREAGRKEAEAEAAAAREAAEKKAAKEKRDAEAAKLEEQKEFQKLSEQQATRIAELEPQVEELEGKNKTLTADLKRNQEALATFLKARREGLPEHLVELLDKMDAVDQLAYLAEHEKELRGEGKGKSRGTPGGQRRSRSTYREIPTDETGERTIAPSVKL